MVSDDVLFLPRNEEIGREVIRVAADGLGPWVKIFK